MFGGNHFLGENDILDNRSALGTYTVSVTCPFSDIVCYCFSSLFPFFIYLSRSTFVFFSLLLAFSLTLSFFLPFLVPLSHFLTLFFLFSVSFSSSSPGAIGSGDRIFHPFGSNYETSLGEKTQHTYGN